jgi:ketosteroid isomerase-like protein
MKGADCMSDTESIQRLIEQRADAIRAKNAAATLKYYTDDVVNFDLAPPLAQRGGEAKDPKFLGEWFETWRDEIGLAFAQVDISVGGDVAIAYGLLNMVGDRTDGTHTDVWARFTLGLERRAGGWTIVHEHQSFPTKMDGSGLSASDLRP